MISTIISALLPILFVAFLGWLAGRMRLFGPDGTTALSTFVVRFALPWSLFLAAARTKPSQLTDSAYAASLAAGLLGTYVLGILLGRLVFRHSFSDRRAAASNQGCRAGAALRRLCAGGGRDHCCQHVLLHHLD